MVVKPAVGSELVVAERLAGPLAPAGRWGKARVLLTDDVFLTFQLLFYDKAFDGQLSENSRHNLAVQLH